MSSLFNDLCSKVQVPSRTLIKKKSVPFCLCLSDRNHKRYEAGDSNHTIYFEWPNIDSIGEAVVFTNACRWSFEAPAAYYCLLKLYFLN